ncbi:MAG: C40 family peptidase [Gemmatimonadota bacterium]|nr:C40 family peptidase [Gemmatimonadota bacterium]
MTIFGPLSLLAFLALPGMAAGQRVPAARPSGMQTISVSAVVYGSDLLRTARRFVGVPYRLGGETPRAFDCSGFVRYAFAQHGIVLPRTGHEQAALGWAPSVGDLEPGDLLFFWGGSGAQHIAIYAGGDSIIHASARSGRVRLDHFGGTSARPSWFGQRLIAIRRVLPVEGVIPLPLSAESRPDVAKQHGFRGGER